MLDNWLDHNKQFLVLLHEWVHTILLCCVDCKNVVFFFPYKQYSYSIHTVVMYYSCCKFTTIVWMRWLLISWVHWLNNVVLNFSLKYLVELQLNLIMLMLIAVTIYWENDQKFLTQKQNPYDCDMRSICHLLGLISFHVTLGYDLKT